MTGSGRRTESAQDVTYRWLKQHVGSLSRHEGTFLTEAEVSEMTGTSRTPVREALLRLEAEGFLQIVPKKGAYVPPVSDAEVAAVMQARELIEDWCVRQVMATADPATISGLSAELEDLLHRQEQMLDDSVGFIECDRAFHRAIVRTAGNPVLRDFYESLRDRQVRMGLRALSSKADRVRTVLAEHAAIVAAVRTADPAVAADALGAHLRSTLEVILLPAVANWPA